MQKKDEKEFMIGAKAIKKFLQWSLSMSMNYRGDLRWIKEIWPKFIGECYTKRFEKAYDEYGPMGVMASFYADLDEENKLKLIRWVDENYEVS